MREIHRHDHIAESASYLKVMSGVSDGDGSRSITNPERTVGIMLLVAFGLANEFEIDSLDALRSVLLEESA
jgi:hypothetical protein